MSEDELRAGARRLGRRGGLKGGKARAASLTKAERVEQARKAAESRWDPTSMEMRITLNGMADDGQLVEFSKRQFQLRSAWEQGEHPKLPLSKEAAERERRYAQKSLDDLAALARRDERSGLARPKDASDASKSSSPGGH